MIAAGRTEEQQTAAEFAKVCPHDVVAAADLMRLLVPDREGELEGELKVRRNAVAAILRDLGAQTYPSKVSVGGGSMRVWMLRNPARWSASTTAAIREEAMRARQDFIDGGWDLDTITQAWTS